VEHHLPIQLSLRLDWSEMDLFGHINNVMYAKYVQAARVHLWDLIGLTEHYRGTSIGPTLAATSIQFKLPLHYPDTILVRSGISDIGNTSFRIQHQIFNGSSVLCATAEDVVVTFDYNTSTKVSLASMVRDNYQAVIGGL